MGFPGGSIVKKLPANLGDMVQSWVGMTLEKEKANHSSILAWKNSMSRGNWQAIIAHRVKK